MGLLWGWVQMTVLLRYLGFPRRCQPHVCVSLKVIQGLEEENADLMHHMWLGHDE